jgi:hypothetical protein
MTTSNNISVRQMTKLLKKFHVINGDIILLKHKTEVAKEETVEGIVKALERMNVVDALVIVVDDFNDLTVLNETEMSKHGWFKFKSLSKMLKLPQNDVEQ